MQQSFLFNRSTLTVTEFTRAIRLFLENEETFQNQWIQGEISNLSQPGSGHIYFTLKDEDAALRCVAWRPTAMKIRYLLEDGKAIEAFGSIGVYEKGGSYQLYVQDVRPAGEGYLYQEFTRLKKMLESEGLFDAERKAPIPQRPKKIGIVTSQNAAALQDILNTIASRNPMVEIVLAPASVQGDEAPPQLIKALKALDTIDDIDLIILARGGGSLEDLWAFNNEKLARTIAEINTPIITGVGHETDFTLADFVGDLRAPTPTGAAAYAVPEISDFQEELTAIRTQMISLYNSMITKFSFGLQSIYHRLQQTSPGWKIQNNRQKIDELQYRAAVTVKNQLKLKTVNLHSLSNRLTNLDPKSVLRRGYAVLSQEDGTRIQSARQVAEGVPINVRMVDGQFKATPKKPELNQ